MKEGDPFPIWGTCNGFELLTVLSSHGLSHLTHCQSENLANPLHLIPGWERSKIYGSVGPVRSPPASFMFICNYFRRQRTFCGNLQRKK